MTQFTGKPLHYTFQPIHIKLPYASDCGNPYDLWQLWWSHALGRDHFGHSRMSSSWLQPPQKWRPGKIRRTSSTFANKQHDDMSWGQGCTKKKCHTSVINCLSPIGTKALACQHTLLYRIRVKWIGWQQSTHGKVCTQHTLVSLLTRCMGILNLLRPKFPWRYPSKFPCQPTSVTNSRSVLVKNSMGTLESFFCADKRQYRDMDNYPWCVCWSNGLYILQDINKPGRLATVILVDCVGFCVDKRLGERVLANM